MSYSDTVFTAADLTIVAFMFALFGHLMRRQDKTKQDFVRIEEKLNDLQARLAKIEGYLMAKEEDRPKR